MDVYDPRMIWAPLYGLEKFSYVPVAAEAVQQSVVKGAYGERGMGGLAGKCT